MIVFRFFLFPIAILYAFVGIIRNFLFDMKILPQKNFLSSNIISVGNLSMGGTGKSVMIEYLIDLFQKNKNKVATLSRGYGRKTKGFQLASKKHTAATLGDEPFQYYKKFKNIRVAVCNSRVEGIKKLKAMSLHKEVFLLDDAFQHRYILPTLSILLTTYDNPYNKDWIFPIGQLREISNGYKRADIIIVSKCNETLNKNQREYFLKKLKIKPYQKLFFTKIVYKKSIKNKKKSIPLSELNKKKFLVITGIANPTPLFEYLEKKGLIFDKKTFPDHFNFGENEIKKIEQISKKKLILTTEKDYVRLCFLLKKDANVYYLPIRHSFLTKTEQNKFNKILLKKI